jgi:hypothetical protein
LRRVPVVRQFATFHEPDLAAACFEDAGFDQPVNCRVLGFRQRLGNTERAVVHAELLEPGQGPARIRVELPFLLGEDFVERLIDEPERRADAHGTAIGLHDLGVAGEDRHPGPDRRLGQVDRRDVAGPEIAERFGQLLPKRSDELLARRQQSIGWTRAADEDDGGRESICAHRDQASSAFCPAGPCSRHSKSSSDHAFQHRFPAR